MGPLGPSGRWGPGRSDGAAFGGGAGGAIVLSMADGAMHLSPPLTKFQKKSRKSLRSLGALPVPLSTQVESETDAALPGSSAKLERTVPSVLELGDKAGRLSDVRNFD